MNYVNRCKCQIAKPKITKYIQYSEPDWLGLWNVQKISCDYTGIIVSIKARLLGFCQWTFQTLSGVLEELHKTFRWSIKILIQLYEIDKLNILEIKFATARMWWLISINISPGTKNIFLFMSKFCRRWSPVTQPIHSILLANMTCEATHNLHIF